MVSESFWMILSDSILSLHDSWMILEWFLNDSDYISKYLHIRGIDWFCYSIRGFFLQQKCCSLSHPGHWRAAKASLLWWLPGGRPLWIPQLGVARTNRINRCHRCHGLRQALTSFAGCESWCLMQIWNDSKKGPHVCGKMYLEMILPGFWELHEKSFVCALRGLQEPMTNCEAAHCRQTPPPRITRLDRRSGQVWCSAGFQTVREAWDFERWNKHLVCRSFVACVIWIIAECSRVQRRSVWFDLEKIMDDVRQYFELMDDTNLQLSFVHQIAIIWICDPCILKAWSRPWRGP